MSASSPNFTPIQQMVDRICRCRRLSRADQQQLMASLWSQRLISQDDQQQIQRVFEALHAGLLRVVD